MCAEGSVDGEPCVAVAGALLKRLEEMVQWNKCPPAPGPRTAALLSGRRLGLGRGLLHLVPCHPPPLHTPSFTYTHKRAFSTVCVWMRKKAMPLFPKARKLSKLFTCKWSWQEVKEMACVMWMMLVTVSLASTCWSLSFLGQMYLLVFFLPVCLEQTLLKRVIWTSLLQIKRESCL